MNEQQYTRTSDRILATHMVTEENRLTRIEAKLETLESDLKELTSSVKDLVDAWKTAGNIVTFIKWISGALAGIAAIITAFKLGLFK